MLHLAVLHWQVLLHFIPNRIRHRDAIAVQIHAEGCDHVCLGANPNGCAQWLTGQHVGTIELSIDHAVEQNFPVGLSFQRDIQTFVLEESFLVSDNQRCTVRQFDEAKFQFFFFWTLAL